MNRRVADRRHFPASGFCAQSGKKAQLLLVAIAFPPREIHMSASLCNIAFHQPGYWRHSGVRWPLHHLRVAVATFAPHQFPQSFWNLRSCQQLARGGVRSSRIAKRMGKRERDQQYHGAHPGPKNSWNSNHWVSLPGSLIQSFIHNREMVRALVVIHLCDTKHGPKFARRNCHRTR